MPVLTVTVRVVPEPLTPVIAMNRPSGNVTVTSCKLLARAPSTVIWRVGSTGRRDVGVLIFLRPAK